MSCPRYSLKLIEDRPAESTEPIYYGGHIDNVIHILRDEFAGADREMLGILLLGAAGNVLGFSFVSTGTLNTVLADPGQIMKVVMAANASGFVICHNHVGPSTKPSPADKTSQNTISMAAKFLRLNYFDDVILNSDGDYYSHTLATEAVKKDISDKAIEVAKARDRITKGLASSWEKWLVAEEAFNLIRHADKSQEEKTSALQESIKALEQIVNTRQRIRVKSRLHARVALAIGKEYLTIIKDGGEPPMVRWDSIT